ncbi:hypothetical protein M8Z33_17375 [Streptomyces sp. ZAF1911]|uniref:hypothetical protein n=1 Tax=Streptomyces sp. ZAF1911 TaxID=2944129 RepID=UPI00237A096A|nr:hypothetical protein [Streptomyces sp. ZAF1911]MDD9378395.1 hypothetical protein [Streptomyces sp. ZAF1911]
MKKHIRAALCAVTAGAAVLTVSAAARAVHPFAQGPGARTLTTAHTVTTAQTESTETTASRAPTASTASTEDEKAFLSFDHVAAANVVSLAHPDTVVSGYITVHDPRTGSTKPFTGAFTARTGSVVTRLATDARGRFESRVTVSGAENGDGDDSYKTSLHLAAEADGVRGETSVPVPVGAVTARIALDSPTVTGPYGTDARVSGTVTWESADGTWKPVPEGAAISAGGASARTDDAGRFTVVQPLRGDTTWKTRDNTPWLSTTNMNVTVDTTAGTAFADFAAEADADRNVKVKARFDRGEIPAGVTSLTVDVQYSPDGETGWTTRQSVDVATGPGDNAPARVEATLHYPGPGFVRMQYAGTPDVHGSATPAVRAVRTPTAVPVFNAASEQVGKGGPIAVAGKLTRRDRAWEPFAGQTVHYYFRPAGETAWTLMGSSRTGANGAFAREFTAERTGFWTARYAPADATHFGAASRVAEVVVTP